MVTVGKNKKNVKRTKPSQTQQPESGEEMSDKKGAMKRESKQAMLIKLLEGPEGATLDEMAAMTGWQRHSIRGVISGVLKKRLRRSITSEKGDRGRVYRMVAI